METFPPGSIKAVTCDLEGTLVDLEPLHHRAHGEALAEAGYPHLLEWIENGDIDSAVKAIPHLLGGPNHITIAEEYELSDKSLSIEELRLLQRAIYKRDLDQAFMRGLQARPGVMETLTYLHRHHVPLAIGSLTDRATGERLLSATDLVDFFSTVVFREDVANSKPAPDVYLETASRQGVKPEEQLVFEDSFTGAESAAAAGSPFFVLPVYPLTTHLESTFKQKGAHRIFSDWYEVLAWCETHFS